MKHRMPSTLAGCAILLLGLVPTLRAAEAPAHDATAGQGRELWLYYATNFQADGSVEKAQQVWTRAAKAGYTHVLLADSKLSHLKDVPPHYYKNVENAKKIASGLKLTLVPALFDIGYSNSLLANDPNLAEGVPVKDTPFVVNAGEARASAEPLALGKPSFADENLAIEGRTATFKGGPAGNCRFNYALSLPPYRCYHVSVRVKTADFHGTPEVHVLAGQRGLQWQNLGVKHTQDWTEHHVVFDTLDNKQVTLYFGVWGTPAGAAPGSLQWKDWKIEEVGLLNVLRRPGAPVSVTTADGKALVEGKDYDKIADPHMGTVPWPGSYQSWHEPPALKLTADGAKAFKDGTQLRVSWSYPPIVYDDQVAACISEPKTTELLADEATQVKKLFDAPGYMMSHDEYRVCGFDASCENRHETPGKMLAENARQCRELLRPQKAYVWNDMFDPFHNAVEGPYYLVNGPWTGSWEGLDKGVIIVNWNYGKRDQSLKFFADRGHQQVIAGYYDGSQDTNKWLDSADKVTGVIGVMYTTWRADFSQIEPFAKQCQGHAVGRR